MILNQDLLGELRVELDLTMKGLEAPTGLSARTLTTAFNGGDISLKTARAIAAALKRPLSEIVEPGDANTTYTPEQLRKELLGGGYGRAHCSAYLIGDFSVLTTKRAYVVPVDAYVHAGVRTSAKTRVKLFVPDEGYWVASARADDVEDGLTRHLVDPLFRKHYPWCPKSLDVTVVAEITTGFGLHEECALALALAEAIRRHQERPDDPQETLLLAGALLSRRYIDISWATLVGSQRAADRFEVLSFNRLYDNDINLTSLYKHEPIGDDLERNVYPKQPFWNVTEPRFELNDLSFWWSPTVLRDDRDAQRIPLESLRSPMQYVIDRIDQTFQAGGADLYRRFGVLMQLHQLLLASANAVRPNVQQLLTRIDDFPGVLGAKLACGRESGAIVLLSDHSFDARKFERYMKRYDLHPLEDYRLQLRIDD